MKCDMCGQEFDPEKEPFSVYPLSIYWMMRGFGVHNRHCIVESEYKEVNND